MPLQLQVGFQFFILQRSFLGCKAHVLFLAFTLSHSLPLEPYLTRYNLVRVSFPETRLCLERENIGSSCRDVLCFSKALEVLL